MEKALELLKELYEKKNDKSLSDFISYLRKEEKLKDKDKSIGGIKMLEKILLSGIMDKRTYVKMMNCVTDPEREFSIKVRGDNKN